MDDSSSVENKLPLKTSGSMKTPLNLGNLSGLNINNYSLNFSLYNNIMRYKNQAFSNRFMNQQFDQPSQKFDDKSRSDLEINSELSEVGSQIDEIETRKQQILGPVALANLERDGGLLTDRKGLYQSREEQDHF